jgi:hypothetical protein
MKDIPIYKLKRKVVGGAGCAASDASDVSSRAFPKSLCACVGISLRQTPTMKISGKFYFPIPDKKCHIDIKEVCLLYLIDLLHLLLQLYFVFTYCL